MHGVNSSNMSHSNVVDSSNMVDSGHGCTVYTSYMIDSMVDSRDNMVVVDTGVDRVDSTYMGNSSVVVHQGVSFSLSLSLTLAVQKVVVVGMRVDSSYMVHSRGYSLDGMDTSYMSDSSMDSRDVSVVDSSYVVDTSVVNYSIGVHNRIGLSLSLRFSLSLTLAVHVVVVEGMRVDSSYMLDSSMDNRSYRSYTVDRVDTSYMMDSRDMCVIDSSYSVANSSVVDQ